MARVLREIIEIDERLCDGCGECISACAEGALEIVNGKARLKGEILCDGAGACLGHCPTGALKVTRRESEEYDEAAVAQNLLAAGRVPVAASHSQQTVLAAPVSGCPGSAIRQFGSRPGLGTGEPCGATQSRRANVSRLTQWPVQLALVPPDAPFLHGAELLIAADCVPFAFADFHERFLHGRALVVGCPKLDNLQHYVDKLTQMFGIARLRAVEVLKMEVPCCGGIAQAAVELPITVTTIGIRGEILETATV